MVPMRKTADLVNEMFDVAKGARLVAIAVGFENETEFVFSTTPHPLEKLNTLINRGGSPVGLLRFEREGTGLQGSYRPFLEYENEAWAKEYLAGLLKEAAEIVALSQQQPMFPPSY
jgi:hypothetical protein